MINAPSGMPVGMLTTSGTSCDGAPAPLVGGGGVATPLQVPTGIGVPQPVSVQVAGAGALGTPILPAVQAATSAGAAALGAATLGLPGAALPASPAPAGALLGSPAATIALPAVPVAAAAATAAPSRLTSLAPGGRQGDADLVEATLGVLRQSAPGAQLVDRMLAVGARINVISDAEFSTMGHGDAHAFYDPQRDTMYLRRTDLLDVDRTRFAAVALAHEGTHLLDDLGRVSDPYIQQASVGIQAAGGAGTAGGGELQRQAMFELMMIKEARAFTFAGQVARDLRVTSPASDPTSVASAGGNDQGTYAKVWQSLLGSAYNPEHRTATVRNF